MNDNILDSIEWHRDQLKELLPEDDFGKVEAEIDEIVEKFRLPGSKDKTKRKSKGKSLKEIITGSYKDKDKKRGPEPGWTPRDSGSPTRTPEDAGTQLRALKGAQKRRR